MVEVLVFEGLGERGELALWRGAEHLAEVCVGGVAHGLEVVEIVVRRASLVAASKGDALHRSAGGYNMRVSCRD